MKKLVKTLVANFPVKILILLFLPVVFLVKTAWLSRGTAIGNEQAGYALRLYQMFEEKRFLLQGPTTEWPGLYMSPLYYYLTAPFYYLGGGNPVYGNLLLVGASVAAIYFLYHLGLKLKDQKAGLIAALWAAGSYYLLLKAYWLSPPRLIFPLSLLMVYVLWQLFKKPARRWWLWYAFLTGLSFHFEVVVGVTYVLITPVIFWLLRRNLPALKTFFIGTFLFSVNFLPQILMEIRARLGEGIIFPSTVIYQNLFEEKAFTVLTGLQIKTNLAVLVRVFNQLLFPNTNIFFVRYLPLALVVLVAIGVWFLWRNRPDLKQFFKANLLLFAAPLLLALFYQGTTSSPEVSSHWLYGVFYPLFLIFGLVFSQLLKKKPTKYLAAVFLAATFFANGAVIVDYLTTPRSHVDNVVFDNQIKAVRWISQSSQGQFNAYFSPSLDKDKTYEYLFLWQGSEWCGRYLCGWDQKGRQQSVYLIWEECRVVCPERLIVRKEWFDQFNGITKLMDEADFGRVRVQKRVRL